MVHSRHCFLMFCHCLHIPFPFHLLPSVCLTLTLSCWPEIVQRLLKYTKQKRFPYARFPNIHF